MESVIVNRFYSRLEKAGLKRHKPSKDELTYLETLGDIQKCDAFLDEIDYNMSKYSEIAKTFRVKILPFLGILCVFTLLVDFIFLRSAIFFGLLLILTFLYSKYRKKYRILNHEKMFTKTMREFIIKDMFK